MSYKAKVILGIRYKSVLRVKSEIVVCATEYRNRYNYLTFISRYEHVDDPEYVSNSLKLYPC